MEGRAQFVAAHSAQALADNLAQALAGGWKK
jgi:hypothetical protein